MPTDPIRIMLFPMFAFLIPVIIITGAFGLLLLYLKLRIFKYIRTTARTNDTGAAILGQLFRRATDPTPVGDSGIFHTKDALLSPSEQKLFHRLVEAMPEHLILAQVAYSQIMRADDYATNNTMRQKVADYVVCTHDLKMICIIELDDHTHDEKKAADAERDARVAQAGLKTVRWNVAAMPDRAQIRWKVLGLKVDADGGDVSRWAPH